MSANSSLEAGQYTCMSPNELQKCIRKKHLNKKNEIQTNESHEIQSG